VCSKKRFIKTHVKSRSSSTYSEKVSKMYTHEHLQDNERIFFFLNCTKNSFRILYVKKRL